MNGIKNRQFDFLIGLFIGVLIGILGEIYGNTLIRFLELVTPDYNNPDYIISSFYGQTVLLVVFLVILFYFVHKRYR